MSRVRRQPGIRDLLRGTALLTFAGLLLGGLPGTVAAAPPTIEAPALRQIVGTRQGDRGPDVKAIQQALIGKGVNVPGGADGVFGPATKSALATFQAQQGLPNTGQVDSATAAALGLTSGSTTQGSAGAVLLSEGATGSGVTDVQRRLLAAGVFVAGGADGVWGPATTKAVSDYQRWNGLVVTGTLTEQTAAKLGIGEPAPPPDPEPDPAPPPASTNPYVGLKQGNTGSKVKELQQALMGTGITVRGGADGQFGPATKTALINFQSVNGIPTNGIVTQKGANILKLGQPAGFAPPPVSTNGGGWPVFGESGQRVKVMQQALINAGITVPGGADGDFGAATSGAIIKFQRRESLVVSGKIDDQTGAELGLSPSDPPPPPPPPGGVSIDVFPVQGTCWFGDTWHAPRSGNRVHEGVDIIAAEGNLLYAVVDGTISKQYWDYPGALAGNGFRLAQDDGTYFTYLHLSAFADEIVVDSVVKAGQVIGYVGNTGSSATAHLHFEVHPGGGGAISPYPVVKAVDACDVTAPLPTV
jgi:peptidoglycan hydrolase-like protein with peptidoglycan-binding domain